RKNAANQKTVSLETKLNSSSLADEEDWFATCECNKSSSNMPSNISRTLFARRMEEEESKKSESLTHTHLLPQDISE
ncbi:MAG: hypothetical protein O7C56_07165, partial [Rickettsia endosymbiont of Ixodes persulcatus]|nr:hypothetical protein [Rickettsia endosymbiont of Ixodes persulcatus]